MIGKNVDCRCWYRKIFSRFVLATRTIERTRLSVIWSGAQRLIFSHIILDNTKGRSRRERSPRNDDKRKILRMYDMDYILLLLDLISLFDPRGYFSKMCLLCENPLKRTLQNTINFCIVFLLSGTDWCRWIESPRFLLCHWMSIKFLGLGFDRKYR